jgi:hypothetical protein
MELHLEARAGDVMAGVGGAAGPATDVRHQPQGDPKRKTIDIYCSEQKSYTHGITVELLFTMLVVRGSNPEVMHIF